MAENLNLLKIFHLNIKTFLSLKFVYCFYIIVSKKIEILKSEIIS